MSPNNKIWSLHKIIKLIRCEFMRCPNVSYLALLCIYRVKNKNEKLVTSYQKILNSHIIWIRRKLLFGSEPVYKLIQYMEACVLHETF